MNRSSRTVDPSRWRRFLRELADYLDAPESTLTVLFCGDEEIAELNDVWRSKPRPTDVLSFEGHGATAEDGAHLGDLAISLETAARQARRAGHSLGREIEMLLTHGVLHLMGYDHETDDGTMMRLQSRALAALRGSGRHPAKGRSRRLARRRRSASPGRPRAGRRQGARR